MFVVPAKRPDTRPVLLMVATFVFVEIQGTALPLGVPEPDNCIEDPTQATEGPVIVGKAFT